MFYTIYKITNILNNKIYIGKHKTHRIDDSYFGSGKNLKIAMKKFGKRSFKKEVLFVFDNKKEMDDKENEIVNEDFCNRPDTYNISHGNSSPPKSWMTRQKVSEKNCNQKKSIDHKKNISRALHEWHAFHRKTKVTLPPCPFEY